MLDRSDLGPESRFAIADLRANPASNTLRRNGKSSHLEPKAMDLLRVLASVQGEVAARNWLIETVWGLEYGGDESLSRAVSLLRKAFRELGAPGDIIETVPKRGYRLTYPVEIENGLVGDTLHKVEPATGSEMTPSRFAGPAMAILLLIALIAGAVYFANGASREASVAVMPFVAMSEEPSDQSFAEGLTEEITSRLAANSELKVSARTSAFSFQGRNVDIRSIGKQLGVAHALEGSVRRAGDRIRITAQLVDTSNGYHLWSETFDREITVRNVLDIQDEVSRAVLQQMQLQTDTVRNRSARMTKSAEAYQAYLRGKGHFREVKPKSTEAAIVEFNRAVTIDPDFAEAHANLARAYGVAHGYGLRDFETSMGLVRQHLDKALDLAPKSPEVMKAKAMMWLTNDPKLITEYLDEALEISPNDTELLRQKATMLAETDRFTESEAMFTRAVELDPLYAVPYLQLSRIKDEVNKPDEALRALKRAVELDPNLAIATYRLGRAFMHRGDMRRGHALIRSVEGKLLLARNFLADFYFQHGFSRLASDRLSDQTWFVRATMAVSRGEMDRAIGITRDEAPEEEYAARVRILIDAGAREDAYEVAKESLEEYHWLLKDGTRTFDRFNIGIATTYVPLFRENSDARSEVMYRKASKWFEKRNPPDAFYVNIVRLELARWHALNGNHDETLRWLRAANDTHLPWTSMEHDPLFAAFLRSPQYRAWAAERDALIASNRAAIADDITSPPGDWSTVFCTPTASGDRIKGLCN